MKFSRSIQSKFLCSSFCLVGAAVSLFGGERGGWPEVARPNLELSFYEEAPDGYLEERALLRCEGFSLLFSVTRSWRTSEGVSPRFSACLESVKNPEVTLGISVFEQGEFLPGLSDSSWSAYLDSLKGAEPAAEIQFLHHSEERSEPPFILDSVYRQVDYVQAGKAGKRLKTREVFAEIRGKLFVFTFLGPEQLIDEHRQRHNLLLTRMSLIEP